VGTPLATAEKKDSVFLSASCGKPPYHRRLRTAILSLSLGAIWDSNQLISANEAAGVMARVESPKARDRTEKIGVQYGRKDRRNFEMIKK
jgi:hypothetical protein